MYGCFLLISSFTSANFLYPLQFPSKFPSYSPNHSFIPPLDPFFSPGQYSLRTLEFTWRPPKQNLLQVPLIYEGRDRRSRTGGNGAIAKRCSMPMVYESTYVNHRKNKHLCAIFPQSYFHIVLVFLL